MFGSDDSGTVTDTLDSTSASITTAPEAPAADLPPSDLGTGPVGSDGQPRDEHGRFTGKAGETTPPTTAPDVASLPASAEPSAPALLDNRSPHPGTAPVTPEPPASQPLTFRAGGQVRTYDGASLLPDGSITISPEAIAKFRNDLGAAYTYQSTWQETLARTKSEAAQVAQEATAKATTYESVAERLFGELQQYMDPREYQLLAKELALDLRSLPPTTHRPAAAPQGSPPDQSQGTDDIEALRVSAQQTLVDEVLTHLTHNPAYAKLAPDEGARNELLTYYLQTLPAYFEEVNGQVMLNRTKVEQLLQRETRRLTEVEKVKTDEAAKYAALQAALDKNTANGKAPNLPPVVNGKGSPAPSSTPGTFKTRGDYDAWRAQYGLA